MNTAQHIVHPTGGTLRVFRQLFELKAGSVKVALSRPTQKLVTHTVRPLIKQLCSTIENQVGRKAEDNIDSQ